MNNQKPRFTLLVNPRMIEKRRKEAQRQADLRKFIAACERLYEKKQAQQGK